MGIKCRWQDYKDKYCTLYIELSDGKCIWLRNPSCVKTIEFTRQYSEITKTIDALGPDILTDEFSLDIWKRLLDTHKCKNITSFLTNQNIISGIGDYIKAEALYYAKISPLRKTGSLSETEQARLFEGIRIIPRISYNKGGFGVNYYTSSDGLNGDYGKDFKIYGKPNADKIKTKDGHITYWDSNVQK